MLTTFSTMLAEGIIRNTKEIKYDKDVYIYGIEIILSTMCGIISILFLSVLLSETRLGVTFLVIFCSLRIVSGGYHAKTYTTCFFISNLCFVVTLIIHKVLESRVPIWGWGVWFLLILIYLNKMKQKYHSDHHISLKKREVCKKYFKLVVLIDCILGMLLVLLKEYRLFGMEVATITMVVALNIQIKNKGKEGIEDDNFNEIN